MSVESRRLVCARCSTAQSGEEWRGESVGGIVGEERQLGCREREQSCRRAAGRRCGRRRVRVVARLTQCNK